MPSILQRKNSFLYLLGTISLVIGVSETLVMLLLDNLNRLVIALSPAQEAVLDAAFLTMLSAPTLWWLALRPMEKRLQNEQARSSEQARLNAELRTVLDMNALVSITDLQGNIIFVNDKFCEVSGFTAEELLGQNHRILNSGRHDKAFFRQIWITIAGGNSWQGVICNRHKDGQLYWVDSTIAPLLDEKGQPRQYMSIRRDISTIKENEAKLKQLKYALDASQDMVLIADANGSIDYVNPAFCRFSGWRETELIRQNPSLFDTADTNQDMLAAMQKELGQGNSWSGRLLNRRRSSDKTQTGADPLLEYWVDINVTPVMGADGKLSGYVQIQRDVSAQVEQEAALQLEAADTKARLAISEALQQPSPLKDRLTQVLEILFDLQAFQLQRKGGIFLKDQDEHFLELFILHGDFSEEFIRREQRIPMGACLCGRAASSAEFLISDDCFCDPRHEHQFAGSMPHGHYIVPITSGENVLGVLFLYTDPYPIKNESRKTMLTQVGNLIALALLQEQTQAALATARDSALKMSKAKSDFLSNMSHEIRTPMNGVLGMLDILRDTEMSREQCDLVETAANSAEALLTIINDILDFSKLEAGKIEFEKINFSLPSLVEEICALQAARAHSKSLELNCYIPVDLPRWWLGDPTRIRQVLINLIGNAIKFTEQGEISVKVFMPTLGNGVRFEVRDTGIGISADDQARLFQAFMQADSSTARRFGGTGLGLSISKNLIELMGGIIGVESAPGEGTCFWFSLPITALADQKLKESQLYDLVGKRALVVDDNATNRTILEHYLQHWGMAVDLVDNGSAALVALLAAVDKSLPYDVLIMDLHMPNMDGLTLARTICNIPAIAAIPRLLLSSGGIGLETELKALGIAQSMLKPVKQTQLFEAILNTLQLSKNKDPDNNLRNQDNNALPNYSGKRILVAEDNPINQKVVVAMLAKYQLKPDLAENGQAALDLLAKQAYDMVLMDCQMPVMDGYEATRIQRGREIADKSLTRTTIVALTAHVTLEAREICLTSGMDDYLSKPLNRTALTEVLNRWLGSSSESITAISSIADKTQVAAADNNAVWDEAAALKFLDGDQDLLAELVQMFIDNIPDRQSDLQNSLLNQDVVGVANTAHTIKGMAGCFCAESVKALASELEQAARQNSGADLSILASQLMAAVAQLILVFQKKSRINA